MEGEEGEEEEEARKKIRGGERSGSCQEGALQEKEAHPPAQETLGVREGGESTKLVRREAAPGQGRPPGQAPRV